MNGLSLVGQVCRAFCAIAVAVAEFSLFASPVWLGQELKKGSEPALATNNLLRVGGVTYEVKDNDNSFAHNVLGDDTCLGNGKLDWNTTGGAGKSCSIGDNAKLEVEFPRAADVSAIKIYGCSGNAGRDGIHVASISVKRSADGEYETLTLPSYSIAVLGLTDGENPVAGNTGLGNGSKGSYFVSLTDTTGKIVKGVYSLLIDFGKMDNNGTFMDEIEVCGELAAVSNCHVVFLDLDGTTELKAVDVAPGSSVTAPDVPTHEGWTFVGWDKEFSTVNADLTVQSLWLAHDAPVWTGDAWSSSQRLTVATNNLLCVGGVVFDVIDNESHWSAGDERFERVACLADGRLDCKPAENHSTFLIGDNAKMEITFPRAADVSEIRVISYAENAGRDGVHVAGVYVKRTADGVWEELDDVPAYANAVLGLTDGPNPVAGTGSGNASAGAYWAHVARLDGSLLAQGVFGVKLDFGKMDNNGTFMDEIEVCGTLAAVSNCHVVFLDLDGTTELKAVDVKPGSSVTAPDVPKHEGWTFVGWDKDFSTVNGDLTVQSLWVETAKPVWASGSWDGNNVPATYDADMLAWNLTYQPGARVIEVENSAKDKSEAQSRRDLSVVTNGVLNCGTLATGLFVVGDNAVLDFELAEPATIHDLHVFSSWGNGGRDAFEIAGVYVRLKGAAEFVLIDKFDSVTTDGFSDNGSKGNMYAYLACADGTDIAGLSEAVRIVFGKTDNGYIGISEIAISGTPQSTIVPASPVVLNGRTRTDAADIGPVPEGCTNLVDFLAGLTVSANNPSVSVGDDTDVLTDGAYPLANTADKAYCIGDNAVLVFDFERPIDLKAINLYSWWNDTGRNGTGLSALYARKAGKTAYRRVKMNSLAYDNNDVRGLVSSLTVSGEGWLAEGVDSVRLVFGKTDNNGTAYQEIELMGCKSLARGFSVIVR